MLIRTAVGGIIGKLSFDPHEPLALPILEQMLDASARSPDAARGLYARPGIAIGWCAGEHGSSRPVASNEYQTLHVSTDAHITNAAPLRAELDGLGHRFRETTSAELILRAYEQWGMRCFARLRGPFACAIWDATNRRLILARDHVGIRPLYFALLPNYGVVFASELRPLLRDPGVGREWCPAGIDAYLALGYVPAPLSAYRRITKLEPAHVLVVEGRRLHVERYWDLPLPIASPSAAANDVIGETAARLRRVIADQTADGAVNGLLYSGGTASTALLSAAASSQGTVLTVATDQDASEVVRSGGAASMLGRTREIESVTLDGPGLARELAAHCDEPVADPSAISQLAMCLAVRRHSDCALAAHGGATLWAGDARHRVERLEMTMRTWLGAPLATLGAGIGRSLPDAVKGARALSHLGMPPADAYVVKHAYGFWDDDYRRALYTRGFAWDIRESNPFARHLELYASRDTADPIDRALYVDAHTSLPDSIISVAERSAGAAGLRLRYTMLDRELVECAASMPGTLKQRGSAGMVALRALLSRELPAGLMPPARRLPARHSWLAPALHTLVPTVLLAPRFDGRGIVSRVALRRLWNEHQSGRRNHAHRLWSLLMLELWFRDVIDGNAAEVPAEYAIVKAA